MSVNPEPERSVTAVVAIELLLICCVFALFSSSPPPEVNEAHYLGKAKHYWNPQWCPNDQFLNSADAHVAFYWAFGWLTSVFPLPIVAWIGRGVVCLLLAIGWLSIGRAVCKAPFASVLSAGIYALLTKYGHMSGEWVLGGVEAKGFAYGFALIAIGQALRNRWNRSWILLGVSSAFHVLVGGWTVIALLFAWLIWRVNSKPTFWQMLPGLIAGGACSMCGLVPGILLAVGADAATVAQGEYVYVFQRLPHHLLIAQFPHAFIARHLLLVLATMASYLALRDNSGYRLVAGIILGAALIAIAGIAIDAACSGNQALAAKLLKFYWYRITDAYAPMGLALASPLFIQAVPDNRRRGVAIAISLMFLVAMANEAYPRIRGSYPRADTQAGLVRETGHQAAYDDWLDICKWAKDNTPADAVFITPERQQTFKWHAGRAELATWKDVPQDANGIVQWLSRRQRLLSLRPKYGVIEDHESKVRAIAEDYGATVYIIDRRRTPPPPPPRTIRLLHFNRNFAAFQLSEK